MSSVYPRAVASLTSFLTGFYPPPANDKTLPIQWQTIPFSQDFNSRTVIVLDESCPAYKKVVQVPQAAFVSKISSWIAQNKALLDKLSAVMGVQLNNFEAIGMACDLIQSNRHFDSTIPKWMLDAMDNVVMPFVIDYYYNILDTDFSKQVTAGSLITEIINNMRAIRDGLDTGKNFLVYSGHDVSVVNLAKLLGVKSQLSQPMIEYADTLSVELVKKATAKGGSVTESWEVQVVYLNNLQKTILNVPNCGKSCSLDTFIGVFGKYMISDWNALCGL